MQIPAAQPFGGFLTVEDGLREIDRGAIAEDRYEDVREILRGAHDVQGLSHPLGDLTGETQLSARTHLVGVVHVESGDPRGVASRVLQTEGGQRQRVPPHRMVPPAHVLVPAECRGAGLEDLAQYRLDALGVLGAQHVTQPGARLYGAAVERVRHGVRLDGGESRVVQSDRDPVLRGQCAQERCPVLVGGEVRGGGREHEEVRRAAHPCGPEGDVDRVAAPVAQAYPAGRRQSCGPAQVVREVGHQLLHWAAVDLVGAEAGQVLCCPGPPHHRAPLVEHGGGQTVEGVRPVSGTGAGDARHCLGGAW
ncbi:hypothetical protein ABZX77_34760 [Streptomyces sp. NPDC004237]|uniref:hypothetical protein n=1 Tax=Streptomyces sp. NPDC004237 TaxID=3154455 RepID=UPI0033A48641